MSLWLAKGTFLPFLRATGGSQRSFVDTFPAWHDDKEVGLSPSRAQLGRVNTDGRIHDYQQPERSIFSTICLDDLLSSEMGENKSGLRQNCERAILEGEHMKQPVRPREVDELFQFVARSMT